MIYLELLLEFLKIGLFTFGGAYGMIPLIKETTLAKGWLTEAELLDMIGVSEMTPGPIAVNIATFIGTSKGGFLGGVIATFAVVLPAFLIMLLIAILLKKFMDNKYVKATLNGIIPIVIGLVLFTGALMVFSLCIKPNDVSYVIWKNITIIGIILVIDLILKFVFKKKFNHLLVIILSAVLGLLFYI